LSNGEGINLLTIHSSKGLEFDNVIFIDFHLHLMNKVPTLSEYEEIHKNLIYVAITRAKYELSIFAIFNKISPLFYDLYPKLDVIISPKCSINGGVINNIS
jgi:DNA helicase-2/ATP-dependent DNA helicase PcrA